MPDPSTTTYLGLPGYAYLWILALVAFGLFSYRVRYLVGLLRRGRPENRLDRIPRRITNLFIYVFGQRRLFKGGTAFGVAHFFIFWAFVFFAASFFWNLIRGLFPILPVPYSDDVRWMSWMMEVLGAIALIGLLGAALRRYVFTPPSLERTADASFVLVLIAAVLLTFLGGQGSKALSSFHETAWSPIGTLLGTAFARLGISSQVAPSIYLWLWWIHMGTVLFFLAYLPFSKHMHLLASPFAVFTASLRPGHMPAASEGASRLEEFTWRQLYSALSCAECGRCDRVCPAFNSGYGLSPKMLIHNLKELVLTHADSGSSSGAESAAAGNGKKSVGTVAKPEELWACTTCLACMSRCPVFNEHIPVIVEMRRQLVLQGEVEGELQDSLMNLTRYGNSFGKSPRARTKWTRELPFTIKDARKEAVEYLWVVGDYASYDPRIQRITQTVARVFHEAHLDFGILYEAEQNVGTDLRRVGEEGLFEMLRDKNLQALSKAQFNNILTTDPHTYQALKNEYADEDGEREGSTLEGVRVVHYSELLEHLFRQGRLSLHQPLNLRATYHDPCYLARYNGVFEPPRRVLKSCGVQVVEMPRNRENAYCCGAGGGRIWMEDKQGVQERPAEGRLREAAELHDVSVLTVSCPKDLVMFQDALKTTDLEGKLEVKDLIELVATSIGLSERSDAHAEAQAQR